MSASFQHTFGDVTLIYYCECLSSRRFSIEKRPQDDGNAYMPFKGHTFNADDVTGFLIRKGQIMYYNNKQEDKPTKREGSPSRFTLPPISSTTHASTPLPPLPKKHEPTAFYPYQQQQQQQSQRQQSRSQHEQQNKSTYSYSPYLESNDHIVMQQHEEYYYPVYNNTNNKPAWSEDIPPAIDHPKLKKKKDMNERMTGINREFIENREILYEEKLKQLQDELVAMEKGNHEMYDDHIADLEEKRRKMIHDARLMMIYQISSVDQEFNLNSKIVQKESLAERRELQNAMFTVIEEKRKKLKEDKDGEGELGLSTHHTRNKQRLLRKRGEILDGYLTQQQPLSSPVISQKRKQDRAKDSPSHLIGILSNRVEEDIEADFHAMTLKRKKP